MSQRQVKRQRRRERERAAGGEFAAPEHVATGSPPAPPAPWRLGPVVPFVGPVILAVTGATMVAWTWRTWPDLVVDFGREIYLAWRLSEGDTLYVDAKHFSGPLSPYVNAMWFRLFGPGVMTLAMANLALGVLFVALLYCLLARLADRFAATIACFLFIVSFGCAQYTVTGNYNWLCPYSHELTHGVMLAVAGLACIVRYQDGRRVRWVALAGLVTGLIALTKVEVMVAGIPAIALGLGLTVAAEPRSERRTAAVVAAFVGAAALPLVATWLWFAPVMTPEQILRWPLGHWRAVGRGNFLASPFYRKGLGIDTIRSNLWMLGVSGVGWLAAVGAAVLFGRSRLRHPVAVVAVLAAAFGIGRLLTAYEWAGTAMRPLPLVVGAVVLGALVGWARHRREPVADTFALRAALAVFALGMLAKMVLNVRIYQYGFALAAPAAMVAVVALLAWLPAAVGRAGGWAPTGRAVVLGLLAAAMSTHVATTRARIADKVRVVGTGRDAFYTDKRGLQMKLLLEQMHRRLTKDATVVTFPEGAFVNYLTRHRNPTPFYIFDRTTMKLWGEDAALEALEAHKPDWVVIVDRGLEVPPPKRTFDWIQSNYQPLWQFGFPDFADHRFSVMLLLDKTQFNPFQ